MNRLLRAPVGGLLFGLLIVGLGFSPATALDLRSWDQQIDSGRSRFQVLRSFNNEAVLDKETQLIWERNPALETDTTWTGARQACADKIVNHRKGWRLPSIHELSSLTDPSQSGPALPVGHPFILRVTPYWSATANAVDDTRAWNLDISDGRSGVSPRTFSLDVWCVRGGGPLEVY